MKLIKKIVILVVIIFVIIGGVSYGLKPSEPIENNNRLCNVDERIDVAQINKRVIKSVSLKDGNVYVDMNLNDYTFKKLLKYNLIKYGNQSLEAYAINLKGDYIVIQAPQKIGPFKSQVDIYTKLRSDKENIVLEVEKVKVGKITVPKSIVDNKLDSMVPAGIDRISAEKGNIFINFNNVDLGIERISVQDGILKIRFKLTKDDVKNIGIDIIDHMFDF